MGGRHKEISDQTNDSVLNELILKKKRDDELAELRENEKKKGREKEANKERNRGSGKSPFDSQ